MRRLAILMLLLMGELACVRAGFDPLAGGHTAVEAGPADQTSGGGNPDAGEGITSSPALSVANDTCATPLEIDLAPLARGESVTIDVDPTGTQGDYGGCVAETVVRLINLPADGQVKTQCLGGGDIALWSGNAGACPDTNDQYVGVNCDMIPIGISFAPDPVHVFVCRDPAQGPMSWILAPD